jgi:hypothetical protein
MKTDMIKKEVGNRWRNQTTRRYIIAVSFLIGLYFLMIPAFLWQKALEKDRSAMRTKFQEFSLLVADYKPIQERVDAAEQKKSLTRTTTITQAIDDIASTVGVKGKIKSIKGTPAGMILDRLREEGAEIQMEKLTMGETGNLFYHIENAPMILAIKKVQMRKSFENPELLDITMTLSLFTTSPVSLAPDKNIRGQAPAGIQ